MAGTHLDKNHTQILSDPSWRVNWTRGSRYPRVFPRVYSRVPVEDPDSCPALVGNCALVSRIGSAGLRRTATHHRPLTDLATDASEVVHVWTMDTVQQQARGTHRQLPTYGVGGEGGVETAYPNFFS